MTRKMLRKLPGRREDGAATKAQILEAAGEIFAEKGFGSATGKEIALRAQCNSAAVNYYYGGIEGLYAEVLVEAHRRLLTYDRLRALAEAPGAPREKLRTLIGTVVRTVVGPASAGWTLRVLSREVLSPSRAFPVLLQREILPKKRIVMKLVGQILGLPPDHPTVARCCLNIIAPFLLLLVGNRQVIAQFLPGLESRPAMTDALVEHFQTFAEGGLSAIAGELKRKTTRAPASPSAKRRRTARPRHEGAAESAE
jgi:AcrR family transcriptional regulator